MTVNRLAHVTKSGKPERLKQDGGQAYITRECSTFIAVNKPDNFGKISD